MKILVTVVFIFLIFGVIIISDANAQTTKIDSQKIIVEKDLNINLILVGDEWKNSDINNIETFLHYSYKPITHTTGLETGIEYYFSYNFLETSNSDSVELFEFMDKNAKINDIPLSPHWFWMAIWHPEFLEDTGTNCLLLVKYCELPMKFHENNAEEVEDFIFNKIIKDDPNLNKTNDINIIFLGKGQELTQDGKSTGKFRTDNLQSYFVTQKDKASKKTFSEYGLTGYGGNYNMYFFDLYSMPWVDYDWNNEEFYYYKEMANLLDCANARVSDYLDFSFRGHNSCLEAIVTNNVNSMITNIVTPSMLYPVNFYNNYIVDIVLYSAPGTSSGLTPDTAKYFLNLKEIKNELTSLFPYANWDITLNIEKWKSRGLSLDLKKLINSRENVSWNDWDGNEHYFSLLKSESIKPKLLEWANERRDLAATDEYTWILPVLIVVDSNDRKNIWIDQWGVSGFAPGLPENKEIPCCAFAILEDDLVWKNGLGGTDLVIHETGHLLGLLHPFHSESYSTGIETNNFWNQYSSPMTYGGVGHGCGELYKYFENTPCGIASSNFTNFEKRFLSDQVFISIIKKTENNLSLASNTSNANMSEISLIRSDINSAKNTFNSGNDSSTANAIDIAKKTLSNSIELVTGEHVEFEKNEKIDNEKIEIKVDKEQVLLSKSGTMITVSGKVSDEIYHRGMYISIEIIDPNDNYAGGSPLTIYVGNEKTFSTIAMLNSKSTLGIYKIDARFDIGGGNAATIRDSEKSKTISFELVSKLSENIPKKADKPIIESTDNIPSWIKNNAGWWANDQIPDSAFVQGIQFLIKEGVMEIPSTETETKESTDSIPSWIKNNAGWWANDQIPDSAFVQGIQFLIKEGVMIVE